MRTLPFRWMAAALLLMAAFAGCQRTPMPTATPALLSISFSLSTQPLMDRLLEGFRERYPSVAVLTETSSTALQVDAVREGRVMLGTLALPLPEELDGPLDGLWTAPIAVDGIAIVVHGDNPIRNLTLTQLYDVFWGRVWHWSDLEIAPTEDEIAVVSREQGSSVRAVFESLVMSGGRSLPAVCPWATLLDEMADPALEAQCAVDPVTSTAVVMRGDAAVITHVAAHPGAIGYVSAGALSAQAAEMRQVRALALEDVPPESAQAIAGRYRLTRPFTLVAAGAPTGAARLFVDFCLGREGQSIVAEHHAPVRPSD